MHEPIDAKIEYPSKHSTISREEKEEDAVVAEFASALADGNLDLAPRPLYEDVPKLTLAFTPRTAARSTLGGMHLWSRLLVPALAHCTAGGGRSRGVSTPSSASASILNPRRPAAAA